LYPAGDSVAWDDEKPSDLFSPEPPGRIFVTAFHGANVCYEFRFFSDINLAPVSDQTAHSQRLEHEAPPVSQWNWSFWDSPTGSTTMKKITFVWLLTILFAVLTHLAFAQASAEDQRLTPMSQNEPMCRCMIQSGGQTIDGGVMSVRQCAARGGVCLMQMRGIPSRIQER
jgi:hypothetical protein